MDLTFTAEQDAFRHEIRSWLHDHLPRTPAAGHGHPRGFRAHREVGTHPARGPLVRRQLARAVRRPGLQLIEWLIFEEEYYAVGCPRSGEQQRDHPARPDALRVRHAGPEGPLLPGDGVRRGDLGAGLVRAQRRFRPRRHQDQGDRDGDYFVVNGQKTWCSRGAWADWIFCIVRTDPERRTSPGAHATCSSRRTRRG